jgi:hypothetical protein
MTYGERMAAQADAIAREIADLRRYAKARHGNNSNRWPVHIVVKLSYLGAQLAAREEELGAPVAA